MKRKTKTQETKDFAGRLSEKMQETGFTQDSLGAVIGVSGSSVSRWQSGESTPRRTTAHALAAALRTTTAWLLTGAVDPQSVSTATIDQLKESSATNDALRDHALKRGRDRVEEEILCSAEIRKTTLLEIDQHMLSAVSAAPMSRNLLLTECHRAIDRFADWLHTNQAPNPATKT